MQHIGQGRLDQALASLRAAERCQAKLDTPHVPIVLTRQLLVHAQLRLGDTAAARATLAELSDEDREWGEARAAIADLHVSQGDVQAAVEVLAPVLAGHAPLVLEYSVVHALLLDAIARDLLGESQAAEADIERALDLAEPDGHIFPFVIDADPRAARTPPAAPHGPRCAAVRHPRRARRLGATHARRRTPGPAADLSESELRVLRYLPSNLSAPEIASELYLSTSTVKTHLLHIYAKLEAHRRTEAVERARELGLLTPLSAHRR